MRNDCFSPVILGPDPRTFVPGDPRVEPEDDADTMMPGGPRVEPEDDVDTAMPGDPGGTPENDDGRSSTSPHTEGVIQ